jgi:hypothetical protein
MLLMSGAAPHVEQNFPNAAALQEGQVWTADEVGTEEDMREN